MKLMMQLGMEPRPTSACVNGMEPRPTSACVNGMELRPTIACVNGMEPSSTMHVLMNGTEAHYCMC